MLASCLRATAIILARWRDVALGTTKSTNMTQLQTLLPQLLLTRLAGLLTSSNWRPLKNLLIRLAIRRFNINMAEAETSDIEAYPNFNSFFTRALAAGVPDRYRRRRGGGARRRRALRWCFNKWRLVFASQGS